MTDRTEERNQLALKMCANTSTESLWILVEDNELDLEKISERFEAMWANETQLKLVREEYARLLARAERLQEELEALKSSTPTGEGKNPPGFNDWLLSLPEGRQKVLIEDKWMLAEAAFSAGRNHSTN